MLKPIVTVARVVKSHGRVNPVKTLSNVNYTAKSIQSHTGPREVVSARPSVLN